MLHITDIQLGLLTLHWALRNSEQPHYACVREVAQPLLQSALEHLLEVRIDGEPIRTDFHIGITREEIMATLAPQVRPRTEEERALVAQRLGKSSSPFSQTCRNLQALYGAMKTLITSSDCKIRLAALHVLADLDDISAFIAFPMASPVLNARALALELQEPRITFDLLGR